HATRFVSHCFNRDRQTRLLREATRDKRRRRGTSFQTSEREWRRVPGGPQPALRTCLCNAETHALRNASATLSACEDEPRRVAQTGMDRRCVHYRWLSLRDADPHVRHDAVPVW